MIQHLVNVWLNTWVFNPAVISVCEYKTFIVVQQFLTLTKWTFVHEELLFVPHWSIRMKTNPFKCFWWTSQVPQIKKKTTWDGLKTLPLSCAIRKKVVLVEHVRRVGEKSCTLHGSSAVPVHEQRALRRERQLGERQPGLFFRTISEKSVSFTRPELSLFTLRH